MRIVKFVLTGLLGISVNLSVFHGLYKVGVPYLFGSMVGLLVAMSVTFTLQKYWTFRDHATTYVHAQFLAYMLLGVANLMLNTGVVYLLVSQLHVFYLVAQAVGAALVSIDSYVMYRWVIFTQRNT